MSIIAWREHCIDTADATLPPRAQQEQQSQKRACSHQSVDSGNARFSSASTGCRSCMHPPCPSIFFCLLPQIGFPLQYNQYPLLRALWNIRFLAQVVAHKVLPFLISPPLFLMIQDPQQSYSSVLAATERSRAILYALVAALVAGVGWLLQKFVLKAAGAAA